jgi:hypothetical protein
MRQVLSVLEAYHKNSKHFGEGELTEDTIYLSSLYDKVFIDPGFYNELSEIPNYLQPPEKEISEKSDIYMIGFLFVRMVSLLSSDKIQEFFNNTPKYSTQTNFLSPRAGQQNLIDEIKKLKTEYSSSTLNLILQMIEPNPKHRPELKDLIKEFNLIYQKVSKELPRKESIRDIELDSERKQLLGDEIQRRYLKGFTRSEYTVECILFYEDVLLFSKLTTNQERYAKAIEICDSYLYSTSELEINVSGTLKSKLSLEIEQSKLDGIIDEQIFDEIQSNVIQTLMIGGYNRFVLGRLGMEWKEYRERKQKAESQSRRKSLLSVESGNIFDSGFSASDNMESYQNLAKSRGKIF